MLSLTFESLLISCYQPTVKKTNPPTLLSWGTNFPRLQALTQAERPGWGQRLPYEESGHRCCFHTVYTAFPVSIYFAQNILFCTTDVIVRVQKRVTMVGSIFNRS